MSIVRKRFRPDPLDVAGVESWLENLAAQGLFFQGTGPFAARFLRDIPRPVRYRLEPVDPRRGMADEMADYYEQCGWRFVAPLGASFRVYRADDPDAGELHTDPVAQSYTLDALNRWLRRSAVLLACCLTALVFFLALPLLLSRWPVLTAVQSVAASQALLVAAEFLAVGTFLREAWGIRRLRRQLRAGLPISHRTDWRRSRLGARLFLLTATLLILCSIGMNLYALTARRELPLSEAGTELPLVSLAELEGDPAYEPLIIPDRGGQDRSNWVSSAWSPLARHIEVRQTGRVPGRLEEDGQDYTCSLTTDLYALTLSPLSGPLLDDLLYRYTQYFPGAYTVTEVSHPGLDRAVLAVNGDWPGLQVFASRGSRVVYLDYSGAAEAQPLLDAAATLLAEEQNARLTAARPFAILSIKGVGGLGQDHSAL